MTEETRAAFHERMAVELLARAEEAPQLGDKAVGQLVQANLIAQAQVHATLAARPEAVEFATLEGTVSNLDDGPDLWVGATVAFVQRINDAPDRLQPELGEVIEAHHSEGEASTYLVRWRDLDDIMRHSAADLAVVILPV